jgi:hypothetical protein
MVEYAMASASLGFKWSKWAVGATLGVIIAMIFCIAIGFFKSSDTYIIYVFSSIVTFAVIRQYTNAKALRIEASNRVLFMLFL